MWAAVALLSKVRGRPNPLIYLDLHAECGAQPLLSKVRGRPNPLIYLDLPAECGPNRCYPRFAAAPTRSS
jgi:hypothetical protein